MTLPRVTAQMSTELGSYDETYAPFRSFTAQMDQNIDQVITYFNERMAIEQTYFESLDKLARKVGTGDQNALNGERTAANAWASIGQLTHAISSSHGQLGFFLKQIVQDLNKVKVAQQQALEDTRQLVRRHSKDYYEMKLHAVPKLKHSYLKRNKEMESIDKEKEGGVTNVKVVKLAKDITGAEQNYRKGVIELEESRQRLQDVREQAQRSVERLESTRVSAVKVALSQYTDAEAKLAKVGGEAVDRCNAFIEFISPQVDCHFLVRDFSRIFPDPTPLFFESYTHGAAKDMVFGIALEKLLRWHPAVGIPALLLKCVLAIEARGLDKEGIYRVSGKHSDVNDLKQRLEVDVYSINLEDDKWDVHVIAGLVKMYLRQLPTPVFEFPAKERSEYAQITDEKERVLRLRQRVKALPRSHHTVLRFLVDHLTKVTAHSAYNKMTVPNIALIFAPVVFQGQPELPTEGGNQSTSLAAQFFGKGQHGGDASKGLSDMSQYDIFKSDGVLEDLINLRDWVFSAELPRPDLINRGQANSVTLPKPPPPPVGGGDSGASIPLRTDSLPDRRKDSTGNAVPTDVASGGQAQSRSHPELPVVDSPLSTRRSRTSMPPPGRLTTVDGAGPSSLSAGDPGGMAGAVQALLNRDRAMSLTVGSGAPPPPVERRDSLQANVNAPHLSKYVIPPLTVVNRDADAPSDDDDDESPIDRSRSNSSSTLHPVISGNPIVRRSPSPAAASPSSSPQVQHTPPSGLYRPASNPSMDKSLSSMSSGGGHLISVPNSALQPYTTYQHPQHIHQQQSQTQQQSNHSSQQQPTQSLPIQHQNILPVLSPVDTPFSSNPNSAAPVYQPQQQQKQNQQSTPTLPSMHDRPPVPPKNNS